jgi:16S rRNA (cytidine1402-2'-O)-methyltransferase
MKKKNLTKIIDLLKNGAIISLISDAGTPSISDPGIMLVNECIKNQIEVVPIPGPTASVSAFSISGFSEKFYFYGFFPEKKKIIVEDLEILSQLNCSIVFFISPKKLNKAIPFLKKSFAGRKILICREITKMYEEFIRLEIDELNVFKNNFKGELTIVISGKNSNKKASQELSESDKRNIMKMINKFSIKEIIGLVNPKNEIPKKLIYDYCLKLKNEN